MIVKSKGGVHGSSSAKVLSTDKDAPPKSSVAPAMGSSSSSAEADKEVAAAIAAPVSSESKAKIQDKSHNEVLDASVEAQIEDKGMGEGASVICLSSHERSQVRHAYANLGPLSDRSGIQLPHEPQIVTRDIVSPSRGGELFLHSEKFLPFNVTFDSVEAAAGSSLACDEVPANTFVMSAQAAEPSVTAAEMIRLPRVEDELMLQGGDTLYKSLLSSQVKGVISRMKADRDTLRKDLDTLEMKVKEKEEAFALSEKRLAALSSDKEALCKSADDFKLKVASLEKQIEELDSSLAKVNSDNEDLRKKVDAIDQERAALVEANRLRLSSICGQIRNALLSDLLHSLEVGGSDALAKAASDSFSLVATDSTPPPMIEALLKLAGHVDDSFWSRVLSIGQEPQNKDSSDLSLSEFATPKAIPDADPGKRVAPDSSSYISLSEFATPGPSSHLLASREPPIEVFSSPSEIVLSTDSEPLSPVEGGESPVICPPGSLVAVIRFRQPESDAFEGRRGCGKRGSRGRRSRRASSSGRGATRKKRGGRCCRELPADSEGTSSCFDPASHVERMVSSGVVDPIFHKPDSPSSGYAFDEFSIICQMLLELGLIVKQEPDEGCLIKKPHTLRKATLVRKKSAPFANLFVSYT
ncbi:hypothetical protein EJB05_44348, partial [Eragrostis curvula]